MTVDSFGVAHSTCSSELAHSLQKLQKALSLLLRLTPSRIIQFGLADAEKFDVKSQLCELQSRLIQCRWLVR